MKWGSISAHKLKAQKNLLCLFHCEPRLLGVSLKSPGVDCIAQVPENREDVGQNDDVRKTVSATLSVLK